MPEEFNRRQSCNRHRRNSPHPEGKAVFQSGNLGLKPHFHFQQIPPHALVPKTKAMQGLDFARRMACYPQIVLKPDTEAERVQNYYISTLFKMQSGKSQACQYGLFYACYIFFRQSFFKILAFAIGCFANSYQFHPVESYGGYHVALSPHDLTIEWLRQGARLINYTWFKFIVGKDKVNVHPA